MFPVAKWVVQLRCRDVFQKRLQFLHRLKQTAVVLWSAALHSCRRSELFWSVACIVCVCVLLLWVLNFIQLSSRSTCGWIVCSRQTPLESSISCHNKLMFAVEIRSILIVIMMLYWYVCLGWRRARRELKAEGCPLWRTEAWLHLTTRTRPLEKALPLGSLNLCRLLEGTRSLLRVRCWAVARLTDSHTPTCWTGP